MRAMSLIVDCPACRQAVTASTELIGRVMGCPHCARHFMIPGEGAAPVSVATPQSVLQQTTHSIRFTFSCQRCGSILEARGHLCGKHGRCPTCGAVFTIPAVDIRTGLPTGPAEVAEDGQLPTPLHAFANAGDKAPKILRLDNGDQVIECPRCRRRASIEANICEGCGMPFTMEGAAAIVEFSTGQSNGLASAALVLGVVSCVTTCFPGGAVAICLGVMALNRSKKMEKLASSRGSALTGIIFGALSLFWSLIYF